MKCLSIRQLWASLIVIGQKDIENRRWNTRYRGDILIHASQTLDHAAIERYPLHRFPVPITHYERGGIIGVATLVDVVTQSDSQWFEGPYGFVLRDAKPLPFVAMRGKQGLFEVDEQLLERVEVPAHA